MITVYVITNVRNGMQYVGQTACSLRSRLRRHSWPSNRTPDRPISLAIGRHGLDSFEIRPLERCATRRDGLVAELKWAKKLKSFYPCGYNLKAGSEEGSASPELSRRQSAGLSTKRYRFMDPRGKVREFCNLRAYCRDHGLKYKKMSRLANGGLKHYRGWRTVQ